LISVSCDCRPKVADRPDCTLIHHHAIGSCRPGSSNKGGEDRQTRVFPGSTQYCQVEKSEARGAQDAVPQRIAIKIRGIGCRRPSASFRTRLMRATRSPKLPRKSQQWPSWRKQGKHIRQFWHLQHFS
jgi:hypothetical protein